MPFGSSPEHRVLARVLLWLAIGDCHHIMWSTNALCQQLVLTVTCSWASLLKPYIQRASHFKLLSEYKTWIPAPLLHLSMARCQSGSQLQPLTSVFCTIAALVPYSSVSSRIWRNIYLFSGSSSSYCQYPSTCILKTSAIFMRSHNGSIDTTHTPPSLSF